MGLVERLLVEFRTEVGLERLVEVSTIGEPFVNLRDLLGGESLHPRGVIQRLSDDLTRSLVPLELYQNQRPVRRDDQEVDDSSKLCFLLPPDQHPLPGEDRGTFNDHVLQVLLGREF